jgi:hypothetical protein
MVAAPAMSLSMRPEFARPLMISLKKMPTESNRVNSELLEEKKLSS